VAELVDALVSNTSDYSRVGSTPTPGTNLKKCKMKRIGSTFHINSTLKDILKSIPFKDKVESILVYNIWRKSVPSYIAQRTKISIIKNGKLFIKVSSAPLKHTLNSNKGSIIEKINNIKAQELFNEVKIDDLIFL
jgi:hypothetical protein